MLNIAYVAPYFHPATISFLRAVVELPGVRVGLVSGDPLSRLPPDLAWKLTAHYQIGAPLDPQQILDAVRAMVPRLGAPQLLLGTLEQLQVPLGQVREVLNLEGMKSAAARNFREKSRMKHVLRAAGLPVARHRLVDSVDAGLDFARNNGLPIVVKPPDGAGGKATYRANSLRELQQILHSLHPKRSRPILCEEFVQGEERSFEVMSLAGAPVWWSSTRYSPTPLKVLENPWIQWTVTLPREMNDPSDPNTRALGAKALQALGMDTGLSHMEWFRRHDGTIAISEIGARPPGAQIVSMMSYAHNINMFQAWANAVVFKKFNPPRRKFAAGTAFFRGQGEGSRVVAVEGLAEAQQKTGQHVVQAKLPRVGQAKADSYEGEGYAIVKHPETRIVDHALKVLISTVRVRLG
ncbi:MAG: ATP-grasp domain-containing protein [Myxococcota bacterium]